MRREASPPRPDRDARFTELGFDHATVDGEPYWDETARFVFTLDEIENRVEKATADLVALTDELVDRVVEDETLLRRLRIPRHAWEAIAASRHDHAPSLYGRFDFAYDGHEPPKLLEFNADTPTSLYEAAVVQWDWLETMIERGQLPAEADQFNSLHERLIERWRQIGADRPVHFACMRANAEDACTTDYLARCAAEAGLETFALDMADIGSDGRVFVDRSGRGVEHLFKLYPWEWAFADDFGHSAAIGRTRFIEPPWKMILSNKGMLALLWEMAPGHPNLLPAFFEDDPAAAKLGSSYARKPLFSREGANVSLHHGRTVIEGLDDGYGTEGFIRQTLRPLPRFEGGYALLGSWVVADEPAGMGIRQDLSPITSDRARFVPHVILG